MIEELLAAMQRIELNWPQLRLLVVGDVMLDRYIWGEVARISPEAPVPIVRATHQSEQPGGAGNVAMNLSRLGAKTVLVGFAGADENRRELEAALHTAGIESQLVESTGFPTITKLRIVGGRQQMLRLDSERLDARPAEDYDRLLASALEHLNAAHAVVLSDYAKGALSPKVCQAVIQAARQRDIPVLVDPKSVDFSRYRGATTICPNLNELSAATGRDSRDLDAVLAAGEQMVSGLDLEFLTATLSERGIALIRPGSRAVFPALVRQVFDVSGAGDTVIAVLALSLASGLHPHTAAQLANVAAGIVVGKAGTVPVERHEFLAALAPENALSGEKVATSEQLAARVSRWRANGERVVFTNGCFDLLHTGHVRVLEQARLAGDHLVVAINSDNSVRKLKGLERPIVGENDRAQILAALAAVDAVVIFDEPTPLDLIALLRPDVIVKGGDYNPDTVVGAREVQSWGGQVKIVPLVEGVSTTRLIEGGSTRR